jgi:prevent-host-death family protein
MQTVTATKAKQGLAAVLDTSAREPVLIQRQERDVAVVISVQEYERLTRHNVAEFQRFCDDVGERAREAGLSEERLAVLLTDA